MSALSDQLAASPLTLGGVKCASVSIKPKPNKDQSTGQWKLLCAYSDAQTLHNWFSGFTSTTSGSPPVTTVSIGTVQTLPGWSSMVYVGADVDGIPGEDGIVIDETGAIAYKYADFTANFASQQWGFDAQNQGKPTATAGVEIVQPPEQTMVWDDGSDMDVQPPITLPLLNVNLPFFNQPIVNFSALINALQNPLNSANMPIFSVTTPKIVLYTGSDISWRSTSPVPLADFMHHFSIRSKPWDQALRSPHGSTTTSQWETFQLKGGGDAIGKSDLNLILE